MFPFRPFEGGGLGVPPSVTVLPSGDVLLVGSASPSLDVGSGPMHGGASFVIALSSSGVFRWRWTAPNGDLEHVSVDAEGRVRMFTSDGLVCLDAKGKPLWKHAYPGVTVHDVYTARNGGSLLIGEASTAVDVGGGSLPSFTEWPSVVVWKLDAEGKHEWSRRLGHHHGDDPKVVGALAEDGAVVLASAPYEHTDLADTPAPDADAGTMLPGAFVTKLGRDGKTVWQKDGAKPFGSSGASQLAFDGDEVLVASAGVVSRLDAKGKERWSRNLGDKMVVETLHPGSKGSVVAIAHVDGDQKQLSRIDRDGKVTSTRTYALHYVEAAAAPDDAMWLTTLASGRFEIAGFTPPDGEPSTRTVTTSGPELVVFRVK